MNKKMDLKAIRRKVREAYFQDGLVDIVMGGSLILYAFALSVDLLLGLIVILGTIFLAPVAWRTVSRRVNLHRIGYVTSFKLGVREFIPLVILIATVQLMLYLPLFSPSVISLYPWSPPSEIFLVQNRAIVTGVVFAALSGSVGLLTRQGRFYYYSLISLGLFLAGYLIGAPLPYLFVIMAGLITVVGAFFLKQFLVKHPVSRVGPNVEQ
jgi:hypothetical protein